MVLPPISSAQLPTIGRIVHYVSHGSPGGEYTSECRAAIITEVTVVGEVTHVGLAVFNPSGMFFNSVTQDEAVHAGGTWHWPEIVK